MGINLALILSHSLDVADVVAFPQRVVSSNRMRLAAEQLWQVMRPRWTNLDPLNEFSACTPWEYSLGSDVITAWQRRQDVPTYSWAGFYVHFGERSVTAVHLEKLAGFVLDLDYVRSPLRTCAEALAFELRSPKIVYGPDCLSPFEEALLIEHGGSLEERLSTAQRKCGAAARNVRDMADENGELFLDSSCYYVEDLDLEKSDAPPPNKPLQPTSGVVSHGRLDRIACAARG